MNWCRETVKLGTRLRDWAERSERELDVRATWQSRGTRDTSQGELVLSLSKEHPRTPGRTPISAVRRRRIHETSGLGEGKAWQI
jgi:hypothetical protein